MSGELEIFSRRPVLSNQVESKLIYRFGKAEWRQ